jgi:hypothetical protein
MSRWPKSTARELGESVRAAIFAPLEKAGVEFQNDGKRVGIGVRIRKLPKWLRRNGAGATAVTPIDWPR